MRPFTFKLLLITLLHLKFVNAIEFHGSLSTLTAPRVGSNKLAQESEFHNNHFVANEIRLQIEATTYSDNVDYRFKGDIIYDDVLQKSILDIRELNLNWYVNDFIDIKAGRQTISWGTGDLVFINDLFAKDWQSLLIGRDIEYLKAPADMIKTTFLIADGEFNLAYTPSFTSDHYLTGERLSFYNGVNGHFASKNNIISTQKPSDPEMALRYKKHINGVDFSLYSYIGFWKSPEQFNPETNHFLFPRLNVHGFSATGKFASGIVSIESGYYFSKDDKAGDDPLIKNSQLRYLLGYSRSIARNFDLSVQYYIEQRLKLSPQDINAGTDETYQLASVRLTKRLNSPNILFSSFFFYSPSQNDGYWRPKVSYKPNDNLTFTLGGNIFFGKKSNTLWQQFNSNQNIYLGTKYDF